MAIRIEYKLTSKMLDDNDELANFQTHASLRNISCDMHEIYLRTVVKNISVST